MKTNLTLCDCFLISVDKEVQVINTANVKLMDLIAKFNMKCREKEK